MDPRLDPRSFVDDPVVRVAATDDEVWLPDRLWARLCWLGSAYELHHLPRLHEGPGTHRLNHQQAAVLLDELLLLRNAIADRATLEAIEQLEPIVAKAARPGSPGLSVE